MNELTAKKDNDMLATTIPMGFEEDDAEDIIIPRVKVIQTLSPERRDKLADEGDIINSLTHEKLNGLTFIPVFMYKNNVWWRDRADGGGIQCIAQDGKMGTTSDGSLMSCKQCRRCEFDNSKQGRAAVPACTKYLNFFGFFAGERAPIILSFSKTSFNEGKKLYSLAKVSMQNMWNFGYNLNAKLMSKGNNEWYVPVMTAAGVSSDEDREFAVQMYKAYRNIIQSVQVDMDDSAASSTRAPAVDPEATEF